LGRCAGFIGGTIRTCPIQAPCQEPSQDDLTGKTRGLMRKSAPHEVARMLGKDAQIGLNCAIIVQRI
jgi:hypothetical protein